MNYDAAQLLRALSGVSRDPKRAGLLAEASTLPPHRAEELLQFDTRSWLVPNREVAKAISAYRLDIHHNGANRHLLIRVTGEFVGISPAWLEDRIAEAHSVEIVFRNARGGDLSEALEVARMVTESGKLWRSVVEDQAASAAAMMFALLPGPRVMRAGSTLLLHQPSLAVVGDATALRRSADLLERYQEVCVDALVARTGKPREDVETWYRPEQDCTLSAEAAVEAGLADEIIP